MDSGRGENPHSPRTTRRGPALRVVKRGLRPKEPRTEEDPNSPLASSAPLSSPGARRSMSPGRSSPRTGSPKRAFSRGSSPRNQRSSSPRNQRSNSPNSQRAGSPTPRSPRSPLKIPKGLPPTSLTPRARSRSPTPTGQSGQSNLSKASTFDQNQKKAATVRNSSNKRKIGPVSSLTFSPSAPCGENDNRGPASARFPSKPPPTPTGGGRKDAPPPVIILRQKSGSSSTKVGKKRELEGFGEDKAKQRLSHEEPKKEKKEPSLKEKKEEDKLEVQGEDRSRERRRSEPTARLTEFLALKKDSLSLGIPVVIWDDGEDDYFDEEEIAFLEQKDKEFSHRMTVLEQSGEFRVKTLEERENDVTAFTELFQEVEEANTEEEQQPEEEEKEKEEVGGGGIQELESLLSTFDLEGGSSPRLIIPPVEVGEDKREKSVVLKQEIEDEFLLIDSLVRIYEDEEGGGGEGDSELTSILEEIEGKQTTKEGQKEGEEGEASKEENVSLHGVVGAIKGQMERLQKMFTSEQASLSRMEQAIERESARLINLAEKKEQRGCFLEKLKALKMKEGEIRQKMENESKELYEKSQLLIKQKRDLLARLSRLRESTEDKNQEIAQLLSSKQHEQEKKEKIKIRREKLKGEREEGVEGLLDGQILELCRIKNMWYKGIKEDLLCEINSYDRKRQKGSKHEVEPVNTPAGFKPSGKSTSPRIKTTGKRAFGIRPVKISSISNSPSNSPSSPSPTSPTSYSPHDSPASPPALPGRAAPPLPNKKSSTAPLGEGGHQKPNIDFVLNNSPKDLGENEGKGIGGRRNWSQSVNLSHNNQFKEDLESDDGRGRAQLLGSGRDNGSPREKKEEIKWQQEPHTPQPHSPHSPHSPYSPHSQTDSPQGEEKEKKKKRKRFSGTPRSLTSSSFNLSGSPSNSPQISPATSPANSPRSPKAKMTRNSSMSSLKRKLSIGADKKPLLKKKGPDAPTSPSSARDYGEDGERKKKGGSRIGKKG